MKSRNKILFSMIASMVMLIGYNNCADPKAGVNDSRKFETQGNVTPYGGKLLDGLYVPSINQVCDSSFEETIQVSNIDGVQYARLDLPCEGTQQAVSDTEVEVSTDKNLLMYNGIGFAHESSARAQSKEHYRVACRTTEANYGAEILVYGPAPVYTFERISLESGFVLYSTSMNFNYLVQSNPGRHDFVGSQDNLRISEMESGTLERFVGSWTSSGTDASDFNRMICDNLSGVPLDEW